MRKLRPKLFQQNTILQPVSIEGIGIHTGKQIQLRLYPAPADSGIRFRRTDAGGIEIPATAQSVSSLELATTIGRDDITISTVEHLLAALVHARVDNLVIELDGPEVPILDGSALPYVRLLEATGTRCQDAQRKIMAVTEPIHLREGNKEIRISPYPGLRISYTLDYDCPGIGRQFVDVNVDDDTFVSDLAPARTFAPMADVAAIQAIGLGRGGSEDNCIVFEDDGPANTELRFSNEPVRHKALDAVGDLALLGCPIWGHLEVERGGHYLHFRLIQELLRHPSKWTFVRANADHDIAPVELDLDLDRLPTFDRPVQQT